MSALFATLPESRPSRRRSPLGATLSVVLHAAAITFAVVATASARHEIVDTDEQLGAVWRPPVPPPATPTTPETGANVRGATTRRPTSDPTTDPLPPMPRPTFDGAGIPDDATRIGGLDERWGTGTGATDGRAGDGAGGPGAGDVFTGPQVERVAELHGTVAPRYPEMLRERGIEGSVTLRFVVDTTGRVEPASVVVVSTTHDLFAAAARATLPTLRFTPAAAGGRRVRQLVELPFTFEVR